MFYLLGPLDEASVGLDPQTLEKTSRPIHIETQVIEDPKAKVKALPNKAPEKPKEEVVRPVSGEKSNTEL